MHAGAHARFIALFNALPRCSSIDFDSLHFPGCRPDGGARPRGNDPGRRPGSRVRPAACANHRPPRAGPETRQRTGAAAGHARWPQRAIRLSGDRSGTVLAHRNPRRLLPRRIWPKAANRSRAPCGSHRRFRLCSPSSGCGTRAPSPGASSMRMASAPPESTWFLRAFAAPLSGTRRLR